MTTKCYRHEIRLYKNKICFPEDKILFSMRLNSPNSCLNMFKVSMKPYTTCLHSPTNIYSYTGGSDNLAQYHLLINRSHSCPCTPNNGAASEAIQGPVPCSRMLQHFKGYQTFQSTASTLSTEPHSSLYLVLCSHCAICSFHCLSHLHTQANGGESVWVGAQ